MVHCRNFDLGGSSSTWVIPGGVVSGTFCTPPPNCIVNIPDSNFKAALVANLAINSNGDTEIECIEAMAYTGVIDVNTQNITDLTGLEAFINISNLDFSNNQVANVNLSTLTKLTYLDASFNSLATINVSADTALTQLYVQNNNISSINVSMLKYLNRLNLDNNSLTALNVSANTALGYLSCGNNVINGLDLSALTSLVQLYCYGNQLASLNVKNGNNANFISFDAKTNPPLSCIQVDDVPYMNANWSGGKDPAVTFSTDCSGSCPTLQITCPADITVCQDAAGGACNLKFVPQPIASPVTISYADRLTTYTGVSINGSGNAATVAPGSSVSLNYNYSVVFDDINGYCPGCVVQFGIGIGSTFQTLQCQAGINNGSSGSYFSGNFTAPSVPGVYYLTQLSTLDFACQPYRYSNNPADAIGVLIVGQPAPTATGGCGPVTFTNDIEGCLPVGIDEAWTATDAYGNTSTCVQQITVTAGTIYYRDRDGDGYGSAGSGVPEYARSDNLLVLYSMTMRIAMTIIFQVPLYTPVHWISLRME